MQEELKALDMPEKQELLLQACLVHLSEVLTEKKFPPAITQDFRDGLKSATVSMQGCQEPGINPIPLMAMMLEEHIRGISAIIVGMASVDPLRLESIGRVSKEEQDLLQRGIEDHIIDLADKTLKTHILDNHFKFIKYMAVKE